MLRNLGWSIVLNSIPVLDCLHPRRVCREARSPSSGFPGWQFGGGRESTSHWLRVGRRQHGSLVPIAPASIQSHCPAWLTWWTCRTCRGSGTRRWRQSPRRLFSLHLDLITVASRSRCLRLLSPIQHLLERIPKWRECWNRVQRALQCRAVWKSVGLAHPQPSGLTDEEQSVARRMLQH